MKINFVKVEYVGNMELIFQEKFIMKKYLKKENCVIKKNYLFNYNLR